MNKQLPDEQMQEFEDKLRYAEEQNLVIEIGLGNELPNLQEQNGNIKRRSKNDEDKNHKWREYEKLFFHKSGMTRHRKMPIRKKKKERDDQSYIDIYYYQYLFIIYIIFQLYFNFFISLYFIIFFFHSMTMLQIQCKPSYYFIKRLLNFIFSQQKLCLLNLLNQRLCFKNHLNRSLLILTKMDDAQKQKNINEAEVKDRLGLVIHIKEEIGEQIIGNQLQMKKKKKEPIFINKDQIGISKSHFIQ